MKRLWKASLAVAVVLGVIPEAPAMGARATGTSMLIVPDRYTTMQVAFDLLERRNLVLVAYQNVTGRPEPALHVWDGVAWIPISSADYQAFNFVRFPPHEIVLIGDDATLPGVLIESSLAAQSVDPMQIPAQDTASVLNALGKIYRFSGREWAWFAGRYRLDLTDANETKRNSSWYDRPFVQRPGASGEEAVDLPEPIFMDGPLVEDPERETGMIPPSAPTPAAEGHYESASEPLELAPEPAIFDAPIK